MGTFTITPNIYSLCCDPQARQSKQQIQLVALYGGTDIEWESMNTDVAECDKSGLVSAKGRGRTQVQATRKADGTHANALIYVGDLEVSVRPDASPSGVDLSALPSVGLEIGTTVPLITSASGTDSVTWDVFHGRSTASVDEKGNLTAKALGLVIITAVSRNGEGQVTGVGYLTARCGTLLVYGADGALYMVQAGAWAHTLVAPPPEAGVPSFAQMNDYPPEPPQAQTLGVWVPSTGMWTTCYVLNPSPLTPKK